MPTTYGRPRPADDAGTTSFTFPNSGSTPNFGINSKDNPSSRSPTPEHFQSWKKKLDDIDSGMYDEELVKEDAANAPTSSSLTPLTASSSLSTAPPSQPVAAPVLPRSSPPSSPIPAYREQGHLTDDPDTSVELNTTATAPSSDLEDGPTLGRVDDKTDDSDDEPAVKRRMSKPLRVFDSDEDEENIGPRTSNGRRRLVVESTPPSSGNDFSQLSLNKHGVRSSIGTTPASSAQKPFPPSLDDDSDSGRVGAPNEDGADLIEDAKESPKYARSSRSKGLNKAEKVQMAKTQQAIIQDREYEIPDTSKRIDPKAFFSSVASRQAEIDSYPFPSGSRARKSVSQPMPNDKANLRRKIGNMLPLSAHAAPKIETSARPAIPYSDPIVSSSQSQVPTLGAGAKSEEEEEEGGGIGPFNPMGALMFGSSKPKGRLTGKDVFGPDGDSDEDLPAASSLFGQSKKQAEDTEKKRVLAEKKRAALAAQQTSRRGISDSDSEIELEIASQSNKGKAKAKARILARPGQEAQATRKVPQDDFTETQVARAGHTTHFGRDAAMLSSSPVRGGGVYEESQFARAPLLGVTPTPSRPIRPKPGARKSTAKNTLSTMELVKHVAKRAVADGQAKQKADEEKWKASGGKARVVRNEMDQDQQEATGAGDREDTDEDNDDYRGSASESDEEDKENLPASGRSRQPHEPVSDLDGSGGDEPADADKENSLELAHVGGTRSPAPLHDGSPAPSPQPLASTLSPAFGRSPSHLRLHSRVSSSGSVRMPLGQLGDEDAGEAENAAVARAVLGELDVELKDGVEDEEEQELPRRPAKRMKSGIARKLFDEEEEGTEKPPTIRLLSPSQHRIGSPSQRLLGSPSRRLGSPSQRATRFCSPPSRLRSPLPGGGTQSFSQVETQAMLGGLGDVFGFESQAPGVSGDKGESGGGLTQLFANAEVTTSSAFAALRADVNNIELTQDERSKLLYRPVIRDDELRRDQEIFERDGELMAQPFSPTQREKETQQWLNERGLWTQTRPPGANSDGLEPRSTPISSTQVGTPSPLASPTGSTITRRRITRKGPAAPEPEERENENVPLAKIPSLYDKLMNRSQDGNLKDKDKKKKKRLEKSEFIEGEAAESDDEYEGFRPRARGDDDEEGEEGEEQHVEGLVDDTAIDEQTENVADVQAKYLEQNAEDDARQEKVVRDVVAGKLRNRRRGRGDNMDIDDDYESDDDGEVGQKKLLKKRKIENDGLDGLEKHESTRPFVEAYAKGMQTADDQEFLYLNQIVGFDGAPQLTGGPGPHEDENEDESEDEDENEDEDGARARARARARAKKWS
ncbi:Serine/arginine repetitive matrix protein [Ceratobasidium sp. AG-Ba]|nr:Serine/arginine repetitive matrix protein [Ceratobasidium sp. AG-Ba]